jgi:nucleoid-associated protein YgaU
MKRAVIVEKGDTLSEIAEHELGRASAWPWLAHLNRLRNPHLILPGQIIVLPRA